MMKRQLLTAVLSLLVLPISSSGQTSEPDLTLRARVASQVIVGKVLDVTSRMGTNAAGDRLIYSDVTVDVSDTLKGTLSGTVILSVDGGTVGGLTLKVSDMPTLRPGDRAVYFLTRDSRGEWRPSGRGFGIVRVDAAGRLENSQLTLADARQRILSVR